MYCQSFAVHLRVHCNFSFHLTSYIRPTLNCKLDKAKSKTKALTVKIPVGSILYEGTRTKVNQFEIKGPEKKKIN